MSNAYITGLKMLGRRELSEAQIRQRLARKGFEPDDIDAAVERLRQSRALDDNRVAVAIARMETTIRRRGPHRVLRRIEAAGIPRAAAQKAIDEVYGELDADQLLDAALARRLKGRDRIEDDAEFARLYRYLVGQGFGAEQVLKVLHARKTR